MGHPSSRFTQIAAVNPCDHKVDVKIILTLAVLVLVALSVFADYKWRQWIAARRRDRP